MWSLSFLIFYIVSVIVVIMVVSPWQSADFIDDPFHFYPPFSMITKVQMLISDMSFKEIREKNLGSKMYKYLE